MKNLLLTVIALTLVPGVVQAQREGPRDDTYARVERSVVINDDLRITSLGGIAFDDRKVGHIDMVYIESKNEGNTLGLELGGGFAYKFGATFFLGLGGLLGYDSEDDFVGAVYPELGAALTFGSFGVIATGKLYAQLKGEIEEVVMLGIMYRVSS